MSIVSVSQSQYDAADAGYKNFMSFNKSFEAYQKELNDKYGIFLSIVYDKKDARRHWFKVKVPRFLPGAELHDTPISCLDKDMWITEEHTLEDIRHRLKVLFQDNPEWKILLQVWMLDVKKRYGTGLRREL